MLHSLVPCIKNECSLTLGAKGINQRDEFNIIHKQIPNLHLGSGSLCRGELKQCKTLMCMC